jgi:hypothetical protein
MDHVQMHLNVTAMRDGREHTATFPAATTAPMANASLQMNVSAAMAGLVRAAMSVNPWLDVFMADAWTIPILVSVRKGGKDIFVTSHHANWTAIMDSAMPQERPIPLISASAILAGEEIAVTSAVPTGDVQIKETMLATFPMNVSALRMRKIPISCATTLS